MSEGVQPGLSKRARLQVRATAQRPRKRIDVPEWDMIGDDGVLLEAMNGTARDDYEAGIVGNRAGKDRRLNLGNLRARLVARCMIEDDGSPVYDYRKPQDIDELGALDAAGLDRCFKACQELNGITDEDVETLEKNSPAEANGVSGSN
jgi:hypothetical protein